MIPNSYHLITVTYSYLLKKKKANVDENIDWNQNLALLHWKLLKKSSYCQMKITFTAYTNLTWNTPHFKHAQTQMYDGYE